MSLPPRVAELLAKTCAAIEPYREDIVLIGGIAKHWYRHVDGFTDPGFETAATIDVDLALPEPLLLRGDAKLHDRLLAAGLVPREICGLDHEPASTRYYLSDVMRPGEPYVECLVAMIGKPRDRPGTPQGPPLTASAVRFLDLVTATAITVDAPGIGLLRVPHPFAYIIQKTRIRPKRRDDKQAKDQADLFYVLAAFEAQWPDWKARWQEWGARSLVWKQWLLDVERFWNELYASPKAAGAIEVADAIPSLDAGDIARMMQGFRQQICGTAAGAPQ